MKEGVEEEEKTRIVSADKYTSVKNNQETEDVFARR
jgi:hypothetical protein